VFVSGRHHREFGRAWESEEYYGYLRVEGRMQILSISAIDETSRHDFREFQQLKNYLVGEEWEAVEIYPAESELKDPSNRSYLWCFPKGTFKFGLPHGRQVLDSRQSIASQRAFPDESPGPARPPAHLAAAMAEAILSSKKE
jgi:hypothetical protein